MSEATSINASRTYQIPDAENGNKSLLDSAAGFLDWVLAPLSRAGFMISAAVAGLMAVPITIDVLARFLFSKSIPGIIELEEFAMVLIVFLSLGYAQKQEGHLLIDFVTCKLAPRTARLLETFNTFTSAMFFSLMTWQTILFIPQKAEEYSTMLKIPLWVFMAITAFGLALLSIALFQQFLRSLSNNIKDRAGLGLVLVFIAAVAILTIPFWVKALPWSMSRFGYGLSGMAFMMLLLFLGMPIGFAMAIVGFSGLSIVGFNMTSALTTLGVAPYSTTASFILAVAPLFIFMGMLASEAGISGELFESAYKWLGRLPGGLAVAAVAGCAGFAAVCGDSMATAVTMGSVSLPEMQRKKYDSGIACGALAAGGTLGILIPPSVGFIFYAIVTEESVGKLFIAGIIPGILLAIMFIVCILLRAWAHPELAPPGDAVPMKEKLLALKGIIGMLMLFILIMGGILGGVFSPTEGGAIGVVGAFLIAIVRKRITWAGLKSACERTVFVTTKLLMILIGVGILGYFFASSRLPFELATFVTGIGMNKYTVLFAIIVVYIILGCLMNVIPMILLTLPALFPTVTALGFDPIWFGVLTVIIMEMGQITPPVGVNVFALSSVAGGIPMGAIFKGIFPFFLCMVLLLLLLIAAPQTATWLVNVFF